MRGACTPRSVNPPRHKSSNVLTSFVCCISGEYARTRFIFCLQRLVNDAQISSRDLSKSITYANSEFSVKFFQMKERTSMKFGTVEKCTKFGANLSISLC